MTCGKKHCDNAPTEATKVDHSEVEGRPLCDHPGCDKRVVGDGRECADGHVQGQQGEYRGYPYDEMVALHGALRDLLRAEDWHIVDPRVEEFNRLREDWEALRVPPEEAHPRAWTVMHGVVDLFAERGDWANDPRVRQAMVALNIAPPDLAPYTTRIDPYTDYEELIGPDGEEVTALTEPEDRTWERDLRPVLELLNRLTAENAQRQRAQAALEADNAQLRQALTAQEAGAAALRVALAEREELLAEREELLAGVMQELELLAAGSPPDDWEHDGGIAGYMGGNGYPAYPGLVEEGDEADPQELHAHGQAVGRWRVAVQVREILASLRAALPPSTPNRAGFVLGTLRLADPNEAAQRLRAAGEHRPFAEVVTDLRRKLAQVQFWGNAVSHAEVIANQQVLTSGQGTVVTRYFQPALQRRGGTPCEIELRTTIQDGQTVETTGQVLPPRRGSMPLTDPRTDEATAQDISRRWGRVALMDTVPPLGNQRWTGAVEARRVREEVRKIVGKRDKAHRDRAKAVYERALFLLQQVWVQDETEVAR